MKMQWGTEISEMVARLESDLPGWDAHREMAVHGRYRSDHSSSDAVQASVLILLYPDEGKAALKTVLIRRSSRYLLDKHRGQIGFPGGKKEQGDRDHYATALREASEEIGITTDGPTYLGSLSKLYIPVSNYQVSPFVAYLDYRPDLIPDGYEVEQIIEVDLYRRNFAEHKREKEFQFGDLGTRTIPYFDVNGHVVWGATAMILAEFFSLTDLSV
jgi:8-oxo-dGTP pyrophosphatase MutT (NUDIX family)